LPRNPPPTFPEPTGTELHRLYADIVNVADGLAAALAARSGPPSPSADPDLPGTDRTAALTLLVALRHLADSVRTYTAAAARKAAEAGADYGDLAAAAGLASRQLANHRWPGLAPVTTAARAAQRALRSAPEYVLWFGDEGWTVWGEGKPPLYDPAGLDAAQPDEAVAWATAQINTDGWRVATWTDLDEDGHRTAVLSGRTDQPRPQDIPTGGTP
jgi:hypothetical protein